DACPRLLVRDALGGGERGANRACVGDSENALAGMASCDVDESGNHARCQLVVRLAAFPARAPVDARGLREPLPDLVDRETFPATDVDLPQPLEAARLEAEVSPDDVGGLARSPERARVDRREQLVAEQEGERTRLLAAGIVERPVRMPLEAPLAVPVGLAVPHEDERRGHAVTLARSWTSDWAASGVS